MGDETGQIVKVCVGVEPNKVLIVTRDNRIARIEVSDGNRDVMDDSYLVDADICPQRFRDLDR